MSVRWICLGFLLAACAATATAPTSSDSPPPPAEAPWRARMQQLAAHRAALEKALLSVPQGNLVAAANTARAAAAILGDGYGKDEDRSVPDFARHARAAESWLLQVALEARSAHGDLAAERLRDGLRVHCSGCHDACRQPRAGS